MRLDLLMLELGAVHGEASRRIVEAGLSWARCRSCGDGRRLSAADIEAHLAGRSPWPTCCGAGREIGHERAEVVS